MTETLTPRATPMLTYAQREAVWGIESEIALLGRLAVRIDERVEQLNRLRAELAERMVRLDALVEAADEPHLEEFLRSCAAVRLPAVDELFPERMYGA